MGKGGSYVVDGDGEPRLVEEPTKDHPEGNAARDADGNRLDRATPIDAPAPVAGATVAPADPVQDKPEPTPKPRPWSRK